MSAEQLIERLARDVAPVPPHTVEKRLLVGAGAGVLLGAMMMVAWLRPQPDIVSAPFAEAFLVKIAYTLVLAAGAMAACVHLMRPEGRPAAWFALAIAPVIVLGALAALELMRTPQNEWPALIFGNSVLACLGRVLVIATPIFFGLVLAAQSLAPTQLRAAGASIGFVAGSMGAAIYAVHCVETAAGFIFLWYSSAILIAAVLGALIAPKLLRW